MSKSKKKSAKKDIAEEIIEITEEKKMSERVFRSKEELIAEWDKKIAYQVAQKERLEKEIEKLQENIAKRNALIEKYEQKKSTAGTRRTPSAAYKNVIAKAKESGLTAEEIAEKLGIEL